MGTDLKWGAGHHWPLLLATALYTGVSSVATANIKSQRWQQYHDLPLNFVFDPRFQFGCIGQLTNLVHQSFRDLGYSFFVILAKHCRRVILLLNLKMTDGGRKPTIASLSDKLEKLTETISLFQRNTADKLK